MNRFGGKSKTRKVKKNKTIEHLSSGLESELRVRFSEHKEIILIGHSMGGLVAKNLILSQFRSGNINNIKAYISMATPHHGSLQAMFLQASRNVHIKELQPLNEQTMKLDNEWGRNKKQLPSSLYIVGLDDEVVLPHCAIPNGADDSQIYKLNDVDHTHICKPENIECLSYILVKKLIKERVSGIVINNNYEDKKKENIDSYSNQLFVIKLIIADVSKCLISSSKESYFKAEISCRLNKNHSDKINNLYEKIKFIYQQEYYAYDQGKISSSDLVYKVHKEITNNDLSLLSSALEGISFLEKIGMLHQLANILEHEVVWSNTKSLEDKNEEQFV